MARFMPKLATTLHIDEVSKEQILQSIQSNDAARVDLLQKLDEKKRLDKELSQKLESNVKAMKDLEKKIRDLEQSRHQLCSDLSPKERTINFLREREIPGWRQDRQFHNYSSPLELGQVGIGGPGDICSTAGLRNWHISSGEQEIIHDAKRKRMSSPARRRQQLLQEQTLGLFIQGSRSMSICAIGPTRESLARYMDDRVLSMPGERLPVVTQLCFRLYPCGPRAFNGYEYSAIIKTDPNQRKLSANRICKLIKALGYTREIEDLNLDIISPDWTRVGGVIWNDDYPSDDGDLSSDGDSNNHGESSEAEAEE